MTAEPLAAKAATSATVAASRAAVDRCSFGNDVHPLTRQGGHRERRAMEPPKTEAASTPYFTVDDEVLAVWAWTAGKSSAARFGARRAAVSRCASATEE